MLTIPLTGLDGTHVARIDDSDLEVISPYSWYAAQRSDKVYAVANTTKLGGKGTIIYMHRLILPNSRVVDHHDGDGTNNQRNNLRAADHSSNGFNSKGRSHRKSHYKGVRYDADQGRVKRWRARITVRGKEINIGRFLTELEAALAYDKAAVKYHGEYALTNSPQGSAA